MTKRLILIVFIFTSMITTAQERTSSPYSFYGVGLNTFRGTVESKSMGGLGIFSDSIHMNLQNPAAYGRLKLTTYTLGASHSSTEMKSRNGTGSWNATSLDYLAMGIPAGRLGFGFGLIPYTSVGYNIVNIIDEEGVGGRFSGRGGLNKVFLAAGYRINDNISIGLDGNYNFGNIENKNILVREGLKYASREINDSELTGFSYTIGLHYKRMLKEDLQLQFGAYYTPEAQLSADNERQLATISYTPTGQEIVFDARNLYIEDSEINLPQRYTFGLALGQEKTWFAGLEYTRQGVSDFSNRSFSLEGATYEAASKYKVGGYFIPEYNSLTSYFSRVVYRAGLRYEETGLLLDGEAINEVGISFGVGLPAGRLLSNVNLGVEFGQRGTTASGLVKENFFTAMISLSLNDRWFVRRKFQ